MTHRSPELLGCCELGASRCCCHCVPCKTTQAFLHLILNQWDDAEEALQNVASQKMGLDRSGFDTISVSPCVCVCVCLLLLGAPAALGLSQFGCNMLIMHNRCRSGFWPAVAKNVFFRKVLQSDGSCGWAADDVADRCGIGLYFLAHYFQR